MNRSIILIAAAVICASCPGQAAVTVTVPGWSNPWLSGMPSGTYDGGDSAPAQSPPEVLGLYFVPGSILTFSARGTTNWGEYAGGHWSGPEGCYDDWVFPEHHTAGAGGAANGISDIWANPNALLGVFLGPGLPNTSPAPGTLDFGSYASRDFLTFSPLLKQVFFIGDGVKSGGTQQQFVVPAGATRLFLGIKDGYQWSNNSGSFTVQVNSNAITAVPEPTTVVIWSLLGILAVAAGRFRWVGRKNGEGFDIV
jgi:hypothetical protein